MNFPKTLHFISAVTRTRDVYSIRRGERSHSLHFLTYIFQCNTFLSMGMLEHCPHLSTARVRDGGHPNLHPFMDNIRKCIKVTDIGAEVAGNNCFSLWDQRAMMILSFSCNTATCKIWQNNRFRGSKYLTVISLYAAFYYLLTLFSAGFLRFTLTH